MENLKVKTFVGTDAATVDKQVNDWLAESNVQVRRTSTAFKRLKFKGKSTLAEPQGGAAKPRHQYFLIK
jgi:hypothetical protein